MKTSACSLFALTACVISGYAAPVDCLSDNYQSGCGSTVSTLNIQAFDLGGGVVALQFNTGESAALNVRGSDWARAYGTNGAVAFKFDRAGIVAVANRIETAGYHTIHGTSLIGSAANFFVASPLLGSGAPPAGYYEEFQAQMIIGESLAGGERLTIVMRLAQSMGSGSAPAASQSSGPAAILQALGLGGNESASAYSSAGAGDASDQGAPEPASFALLGAGLVAIGLYRRRAR